MTQKPTKLGEMLLQAGLIDQFQLDSALSFHRNVGGRIGSALVKLGYIAEDTILEFLENQPKFTRVELREINIPKEALKAIPGDKLFDNLIIPIELKRSATGKVLVVAMTDPTNLRLIDEIQFIAGCRVSPVVASEFDIQTSLNRHFPGGKPRPVQTRRKSDADALGDLAGIDFGSQPVPAKSGDRLDTLIAILLEKGFLTDRDIDRLK